MSVLAIQTAQHSVVIDIGGVPVRVNTSDTTFLDILQRRYAGFISAEEVSEYDFDVDLMPFAGPDRESDLRVTYDSGQWLLERGDFRAEWNPATRRGKIRQTANPYSIDAVLRIVHTLVLAKQGGFLLHSASVIRNGKAFLFAGVSGAKLADLLPGEYWQGHGRSRPLDGRS